MRNNHPEDIVKFCGIIKKHAESVIENKDDKKVKIEPALGEKDMEALIAYSSKPFDWCLPDEVKVNILKEGTETIESQIITFNPPSCVLLMSGATPYNSEGAYDRPKLFDMAIKSSNVEPSPPNMRNITYTEAMQISDRFLFYFLFPPQ